MYVTDPEMLSLLPEKINHVPLLPRITGPLVAMGAGETGISVLFAFHMHYTFPARFALYSLSGSPEGWNGTD